MVVFLFNTVIYVFLLLCLCILIVCLCIFIVPAGTLRLPWLRFLCAFSSVVRKMPGYNTQRRGTARTLSKMFVLLYVLFVLCRSVYCLCVNVYCTAATGWQPNCSLSNVSIHQYAFISCTDMTLPLPFCILVWSLYVRFLFRLSDPLPFTVKGYRNLYRWS
jgi:hypothetical protein